MKLRILFYIFTLIHQAILKSPGKVESLANDDEGRLKDYLFKYKGYNHLIRPVVNLTDVVNVKFGLAFIQLINVEEKKQILKSNVWIRMKWRDYQLVWEPSDFGGIKVTRVSPKIVWKPDIVLFNNADGNYEVLWQPNILIQYDGEILWIPPAIYESSCSILVEFFPFDEQECEMRFGSWTFNSKQVSLSWFDDSPKLDLSTYWKSGTWDIIRCPGKITNGSMNSSGIGTQEIVYQITIRRKTLFYTVILILPCLLISLLTVCVFYLPVDDHHKMTLTISILLALIVFFLLISKLLPPTSTSIPLISKYLLFTFIVNIIVIVITVIIINFNYRTPRTHYMPNWVKKLFIEFLPIVLGMSRPKHIERELLEKRKIGIISPTPVRQKQTINKDETVSSSFSKLKPNTKRIIRMVDSQISMALINEKVNDYSHEIDKSIWKSQNSRMIPSTSYNKIMNNSFSYSRNWEDIEHIPRRSFTDSNSSKSDSSTRLTDDANSNWLFRGYEINNEMRQAILSINFISSHTESQDEFSMGKQDWQFVASVIDRLMLLIFSTVTLIGTSVLFIRAPYFLTFFDPNADVNEC